MKANEQHGTVEKQTFANKCVEACRKCLEQLERAKEIISEEFRETLGLNNQLVHLAFNEAEALAWETGYPHLFFPDLAAEKVQSLAAWQERQRSLRKGNSRTELAEEPALR